jgi:hypothetical protein
MARTQAIMSASWGILTENKSLLLLPVASSACLFLIVGAYLEPLVMDVWAGDSIAAGIHRLQPSSELGLFLLTVATYAVGIYFNAALAFCVLGRLDGRTPTIVDGLTGALACLPQIIGWAVVSSTVGLLLRAVERRSGFVGRLVVRMVGMAWGVATFLVVPVLVAERKGPLEAVQESVQLLRRTWGEDLLAGMGFGGLYLLLSLPGVFAFVVGAGLIPSHLVFALVIMALSILYLPFLGLVLSTLSAVFDVVLYRYATLGSVAPGFDRALLKDAFVRKPGGVRL